MSHSKLPGFTYVELLVVMLLGSIVMGTCFYAYSSLSKLWKTYEYRQEEKLEAGRFQGQLELDCFNSAKVSRKGSDQLIVEKPGQAISYKFSNDFITRIAIVVDTFYLRNSNLTLKWGGQETNANVNYLVDQISIEILIGAEPVTYAFHKQFGDAIYTKMGRYE